MYRSEKTVYRQEMDHNPSFSSTLLDKIYRSIDDGDTKNGDLKFYRETMQKKQSKVTMKSHHEYDHHDVHFFSSTSTSSDSSSGGFSSSDNESMYVTKSKSSCFVTSRTKPVRSEKPHKTERKQRTLFDDHHYSSAAKIYSNSKKAKQPISPGGRLASFINSLFTASNTKKARGPSSILSCEDERKLKYEQVSTCSSASSLSRSCLSKNSRNGVKRSVRFCPVSVIVDEEEDSSSVSVAIPAVSRKLETKRVEEMATKFLKEYRLNQTKNDYIRNNYVMEEMDEDEDDAASYSSSDLFELDHRVLIGNYRYREELPVYETTHVETNRAIANGLIA